VLLSILGQLGKRAGERAACVKRGVEVCGGDGQIAGDVQDHGLPRFAAICTVEGDLFTGGGTDEHYNLGQGMGLAHGGLHAQELSPRLVEVLVGKKVTVQHLILQCTQR